jgi:hypothetical protein
VFEVKGLGFRVLDLGSRNREVWGGRERERGGDGNHRDVDARL